MALLAQSGHGGNVHGAARQLGTSISRLVDFSASINPLGPSPRSLKAMVRAAAFVPHYPDPECAALREALAARWRVEPEQIVVGNGSTELIHLLPSALSLRHLLVVGPTFSEYAKAMRDAGGKVTMLMAERSDGYAPPLRRLLSFMASTPKVRRGSTCDAVLLCNPNSPTGRSCAADDVLQVVRLAQRRGLRVIVDETFADYCPERSILPSAIRSGGTIVLRSFTKFYGLPGLRIGYALAPAQTAARLRERQPPWSVNAPAQAAARAALEDQRHVARSRAFMARERARLGRLLATLPGCTCFPSEANFFLLELPAGCRASVVTEGLRRKGLLIRDCSAVPGLNDRTVRLAVRRRAENERLILAMQRMLRTPCA